MTTGLKYSTEPLKNAIREYDNMKVKLDEMASRMSSMEEYEEWVKEEEASLRRVQLAFHEVTKDRNSLDNCLRCDIDFMRKISLL